MSGIKQNNPRPFEILGFDDDEENIEPLEISDDQDKSKRDDIIRGLILYNLVRKLLNKLSQAQDCLNQKNKPNPQSIDQLRSEIETLHVKIRAEEGRRQDFSDELNQVKEINVEKSDNIQQEIQKLTKFCEHFRSRTFVENYDNERELTQLELDLKIERELGACLEARIAVEREKKQKLMQLLN